MYSYVGIVYVHLFKFGGYNDEQLLPLSLPYKYEFMNKYKKKDFDRVHSSSLVTVC